MGDVIQDVIDFSRSSVGLGPNDKPKAPAPVAKQESVNTRASAASRLRSESRRKGIAASVLAGSEGTKKTLG